MLVYRYEYPDGGGPWFYPDGTERQPLRHKDLYYRENCKYAFGCKSKESLLRYFDPSNGHRISLIGSQIKVYDIPKKEVIELNNQLMFPKHYIEGDTNVWKEDAGNCNRNESLRNKQTSNGSTSSTGWANFKAKLKHYWRLIW